MAQSSRLSRSSKPRRPDALETPVTGSNTHALAAWGSLVGGVLFGWPFVRGIAGELQLPLLMDPGIAPLALASMALGLLSLALGLRGWWSLVGRSLLGGTAILMLGLGLILWFVDEASLLAPAEVRFPTVFGLYLALVGAGSLLLVIDLRRLLRMPIDGLVLVGVGGPLAAALLGAPWPLGLGAVVPTIVVLYALGWIRLGLSVLRPQRNQAAR
jgi:hypothetical protein